jgi:hypothetical protein
MVKGNGLRSQIRMLHDEVLMKLQEEGCSACRTPAQAEFTEQARAAAIALISGEAVEEREPARCQRCGRWLGQVRLKVVPHGYGSHDMAVEEPPESPPDTGSTEDSDDW